MPLIRCRNFNANGSRKTRPNGSEIQCGPDCQFVHPSEPSWDRAPSAALPRERGGAPRGGRGRGQSSSRAPATGSNSFSLGPERRGSFGTWGDYMTDIGSKAPATSGGWGGQTTAGTSGWGGADASGSGWGSSDNNTADTSNVWPNEPAAWGEQSSSSQWDNQATGWGSTGTNLGPGWGEDPFSNQGSKTAAVENVASPVGPNTLAGTLPNENPDAATATTQSSRTMQSNSLPSESGTTLKEQRGEDAPAPAIVDVSPTEPKASPSATSLCQPSAIKSKKIQLPRGDPDNHVASESSDVNKMSYLALCTAMTLKIRELDTELSQLSVMRKSSQVAATRAAKGLLRKTVHELTDARVAAEAERGACSRKLTQFDPAFLPPVQHALATLGGDNGRLEPFKDWVSRAEQCLNHVQVEGTNPITPVERPNEAAFISKLNQLQGRSEFLEETDWQCQDLQFYSTFLDNMIQQKKDHIVAAMVKNHNAAYNHLLSTSLSTLQRQGEVWNQILEIQAGKFAQTLLQSDQLKEDKSRPILKTESQSTIQQLQIDVIQRKLQLQVVQEEINQLQHTLTSVKQQQQSYLTIDTVEKYTSHIQGYIQDYVQANAIPSMTAVLRSTVAQFTTTELRTVEKVWKTLHPFIQISLWLQQLDIYKTEEEMEIREIEESLLV